MPSLAHVGGVTPDPVEETVVGGLGVTRVEEPEEAPAVGGLGVTRVEEAPAPEEAVGLVDDKLDAPKFELMQV